MLTLFPYVSQNAQVSDFLRKTADLGTLRHTERTSISLFLHKTVDLGPVRHRTHKYLTFCVKLLIFVSYITQNAQISDLLRKIADLGPLRHTEPTSI